MSIDQKELLIGTLIGSAIAATAVLLFTPEPGAKMRERMQGFLMGDKMVSRKIKRSPSHPAVSKPASRPKKPMTAHKAKESANTTQQVRTTKRPVPKAAHHKPKKEATA